MSSIASSDKPKQRGKSTVHVKPSKPAEIKKGDDSDNSTSSSGSLPTASSSNSSESSSSTISKSRGKSTERTSKSRETNKKGNCRCCCCPQNPGPGLQETMCYDPIEQTMYQAPCQIGVIPMRSAAFQAPHIPLPRLCDRVLRDGENDDCCEEEEDGVQFQFKPQAHCRTEVTFTIEPKAEPPWLTMLNCGFKPMVNCSAPPCYLSPKGNPGTDFFGGSQSFVNKAFGTQMNFGGLANFPTLSQIEDAFPSGKILGAKKNAGSDSGSGSSSESDDESGSSSGSSENGGDNAYGKVVTLNQGAPPSTMPRYTDPNLPPLPSGDHVAHRDPRIDALVKRGLLLKHRHLGEDHHHHDQDHHHHHHHHGSSMDRFSRSSDWHA